MTTLASNLYPGNVFADSRRDAYGGWRLPSSPLGLEYAVQVDGINGMENRNPFDWFECVRVISLDRRVDRFNRFVSSVRACDWPFQWPVRFSAVDGRGCVPPRSWRQSPGAWGCYRSHVRLLEDVIYRGLQSVLILEDDAEPVLNFAAAVRDWQTGLPDNWQGLWFGGEHANNSKPTAAAAVTSKTLPCRFVTRTHCFGIREPFLTEFYRFLTDQETMAANTTQHIDHAIARFMQHGKHALYCPNEWLVAQAGGRSDIFGTNEPRRMFQ